MVNKTIKTKEYNMGYDIVEYIKKTKENISFFELFTLPQQRKKLLETFDHNQVVLQRLSNQILR